ncbi:unnamed protein product [Enterobius vermicularis]|uniref:SHSP domain-containing protein n=1 Tax=Enterobius vermicularis TaxID=51028 RepID=A0A0N4VFD8_ENTVE|nr:unnamed protein product [Enterobius vermicularis]
MLTSNYYDRFSSGNGGIDSGDWKRNKPSFDLAESVRKLDEQLARVRTSPSKVIYEGKEVTIFVDMRGFAPEEIEVFF